MNHHFISALLALFYFLTLASCSDNRKGDEDGDADVEEESETDGPEADMEDGEPVPCSADSECTDNDPCNGNEFCDLEQGICAGGVPAGDGTICDLDPRRVCIGGACVDPSCGDGVVDLGAGEFCEPPGEGECDENCMIPCTGDSDCPDDGDPCNGRELCDEAAGLCARSGGMAEGALCRLEPRALCLGGTCTASICGDGFLDVGGGEFCEPPYEDGCSPDCGLPCGGDPDCEDDGNLCNGTEYCSEDTQRCSRRNSLPEGAVCDLDPRSICIGWTCRPSICGDGFLDTGSGEFCEPPDMDDCDGECALPCGGDPDCEDDENVCNGTEYCNADTMRCSRRDPLPDGTECGDDPPQICIAGTCQSGACGNGVVDISIGEECDDGNLVSGDGCEPLTCYFSCHEETEAADCGDGLVCTDDLCDPVTHTCANPLSAAGTLCRPLASQCDAVETCTGTADACPADGYAPSGNECNDADPFTIRDQCDGSGACSGESLTEMSGVTTVSAGLDHACAVASSGLYCWGDNAWGQLGNGTTTGTSLPQYITGLSSTVTAVSAGRVHTCALTDAGGIMCWGSNEFGQLGDGTLSSVPNPDPIDVPLIPTGALAVSAGDAHTCALMTGGGVKCWGNNGAGQIGDGTSSDRFSPVDVNGLASSAVAVDAGKAHTCALLDTGGIQCWGNNGRGELGDGTVIQSYVPVDVTGLASAAIAVEAGENHTCALLDTGSVQCWGGNGFGQLGNGTTVDSPVPVSVSGIPSAAAAIGAGRQHSCAVLAAGDAYCWGFNESGKLGNGLLQDPVLMAGVVLDLASSASTVSCGGTITCAALTSGRAQCWGDNGSGQLGKGEHYEIMVPRRVNTMTSGGLAVSAGSGQSCSVMSSGSLLCWGSNAFGELGNGTYRYSMAPDDVPGLPTVMAGVSAGKRFTCAVSEAGSAHCWGANGYGQLGDGTTSGSPVPVDVSGLSSGVASVSTGAHHACALLESGGVMCWGENVMGQLGNGTTVSSSVPVSVTLDSAALALVSGHHHACAALDTGAVQCWGFNDSGQLGDGTIAGSSVPVDVVGLASGAVAVAAGYGHTCALLNTGEAACWGANGSGQLGNGVTTDSLVPVSPDGLGATIVSITCGDFHACALDAGGGLRCWGDNLGGGLGIGSNDESHVPVDVVGLPVGVAAVEAGGYHTCAVLDTGEVLCWGHDGSGEVTGRFSGYPHTVLMEIPTA